MVRKLVLLAGVTGVAVAAAVVAPPAGASSFCVPGFYAACPDNGTNVVPPGATPADRLDAAISSDDSDGIPDTVRVDAGVLTRTTSSFTANGSDDLTVIGAGRDRTTLTSSATSNSYVVNLAPASGKVTMKDLAIAVPASFPDGPGYGAGVQARGDAFEAVDLIVRNPGASGFAGMLAGGELTGVRVFSDNGSVMRRAIESLSCQPGQLTIRRLLIENATYGLVTDCPDVPVTVEGARIKGVDSAFQVSGGASVSVVNTLIEGGDQVPVDVYSDGAADTTVTLNQVTAIAGDPAVPGVRAEVANDFAATGSVRITVENSVLAGYQHSWDLEAPENSPLGDVLLTGRFSRFAGAGTESGGVGIDTTERVTFGNPGFAGITDFHPGAGSPLIDAGDPDQAQPEDDLDGRHRPLDGNGDGRAVRDIGAFESPALRQPAPKIKQLKFRYRVRQGGKLTFRLTRKARVKAIFTPVPRRAESGVKRRTVRIFRTAKAGRVTVKLRRRLLTRGHYRLKLTARTPGGRAKTRLVRRLRVR